ncbi:MAG TPA: DUF72 domain-containing protein [Dokdonella sp.]|nr:DUF72 domain-containing protein [Dokdonella sp.]
MHVRLRIGCAGWSIMARHAAAFPRGGSHLERYARVFDAVEINSSFHRPHRPQTYAKWADAVPGDFRFAVKLPKSISHERRLRDCADELRAFLDAVRELRGKLGVLLLQLPPSLAFDATGALAFFDRLRDDYDGPFACEPRHLSWFDPAVDAALRARRIARVAADPARTRRAAVPAGDRAIEYVRLHGSPRVYYDAYTDATLQRIARRLARASKNTRERWCIFDNTALGHATSDASKVKSLLAAA